MNHSIHSPRDDMRPSRRRLVCCVAIALLVALICVVCHRYVVGYRETGQVDGAAELPRIGKYLAELRTDGPIAYSVFWNPHGGYDYLICGRVSQDQLLFLWQELKVDVYPADGEVFNGRLQTIVDAIDKESRHLFTRTLFTEEDHYFSGEHPELGSMTGAFRPSDRYFAINISCALPMGRKRGRPVNSE